MRGSCSPLSKLRTRLTPIRLFRVTHPVEAGFTEPIPNSEVRPNPAAVPVYDALIEKYARCERESS